MRVAQIRYFGGSQAIEIAEVSDPVPGTDEVLIRVNSVGLNFFDTLSLRNKYQVTPKLPYSPGAEIAGTIEAVGEGVTGIGRGQRVVAFIGGNGCREKVVASASKVVPIPDGVSDEAAAGISITYGTALHGLKDRGDLKPGETLAVLGAAGGAGLAAVEIGKLMGSRVIAVASSKEKLALARKHGADDGLNYEDGGSQEETERPHAVQGRRRALRYRWRRLRRAELACHGLEGSLPGARLCLRDDPAHSAQSAAAQRLFARRCVLDCIRRAQSRPASRQ